MELLPTDLLPAITGRDSGAIRSLMFLSKTLYEGIISQKDLLLTLPISLLELERFIDSMSQGDTFGIMSGITETFIETVLYENIGSHVGLKSTRLMTINVDHPSHGGTHDVLPISLRRWFIPDAETTYKILSKRTIRGMEHTSIAVYAKKAAINTSTARLTNSGAVISGMYLDLCIETCGIPPVQSGQDIGDSHVSILSQMTQQLEGIPADNLMVIDEYNISEFDARRGAAMVYHRFRQLEVPNADREDDKKAAIQADRDLQIRNMILLAESFTMQKGCVRRSIESLNIYLPGSEFYDNQLNTIRYAINGNIELLETLRCDGYISTDVYNELKLEADAVDVMCEELEHKNRMAKGVIL